MRRSATGRKAFYLLIVSIISVIALTAASYAWMTISSTPTVTDLAFTVITDNAMELASDDGGKPADDWSTIMDMGASENEGEGSEEIGLQPVTYIASEDAFFAPRYGFDGRMSTANGTRITDENGALLPEFAAENGESGYLYICDFWIRTNASDCIVALAAPMEREDGKLGAGTFLVGEPVWDGATVTHKDEGNGAQFAMRLALRVDPVDDFGDVDDPAMILYEPNADGGIGLTETKSANGNGLLQGDNPLIQQSVSTWKEATPVVNDTVLYTPGDFITENVAMFPLKSGHARHVTLYLWLEGQDADCNQTINAGRILANIQFTAIVDGGSNPLRPE